MAVVTSFASSPKRFVLILLMVLILVAGLVFVVPMLTDPYDCRIAEGVSIGGLDISGMTRREARDALQAALDDGVLSQNLLLRLPEETLTLTPGQVVLQTDIRSAVREAYRYGRTDSAGNGDFSLLSCVTLNEDAIRGALEDYAAKFDTEFSQMEYYLEGDMPDLSTDLFRADTPCQTLVITLGVPKQQLDVDGLYAQIRELCGQSAVCTPDCYRITLGKLMPLESPEVPNLDAIFEELTLEPVDDSLDMEEYHPVPGSYGYTFDRKKAGFAVTKAAPGETIRIPMEYLEPEILGEEVYFRDVLGSCDTKHSNNENRNTNLRLLCQALDGYVIQPGETFSYNEAVGERTAERGYKPAPAYSGNRLINSVGGGVCQGSTTLYNCVLLADLEVVFRVSHGAAVSYVPIGLDAAVNWGTTDFKFRNSSHFPVKIQAEVSDGYVRMKLLGTDEKDYYIVMTSGYGASNEDVTYAVSYKNKYDKVTGELISKDREAFSSYYNFD